MPENGLLDRSLLNVAGLMVLAVLIAYAAPVFAGGVQTLDPVEVVDTDTGLLGTADTASEGTVTKDQLDSRPIYREGELLENVPGLIVTQHSGEGKANQYFLRGFNLDHGTDLETTIDDMPVNERTHAHGQGYTDLNFMIPELASGIQYRKGPYFADEGDFATAGAVHIGYLDILPKNIAEVGIGSFGYERLLSAQSEKWNNGNILVAAEGQHLNGPWTTADDYKKGNFVLRYSEGSQLTNGWSATAMGYKGDWNATNQVAQRAIDEGVISEFGSLNPTDGGNSQRYSLSGKYIATDSDRQIKASVYGIYSTLNLYNDFTYYLYNPIQGDQFHQEEQRFTTGGKAEYTFFGQLLDHKSDNSFGTEVRDDQVHIGLSQTEDQQYLSTDRVDIITESSIGLYWQNKTQWLSKMRTVAGLREDVFYGDDHSDNPLNSGSATQSRFDPKGSVIFGPWASTEFYFSAGNGFHSNDLRSVFSTVEPNTYNNRVLGVVGQPLQRFPIMEGAFGEEIGIRTAIIPHLETSLSFFRLNLDSEQVFNGDAGDTSPSSKSRRQGVEFSNFYTPMHGVTIDADIAYTVSRYGSPTSDGNAVGDTTGSYIGGSPGPVAQIGIALDDFGPWFGGAQFRYFGSGPLTNDDSIKSTPTALVNARVGYKITDGLNLKLDVDNLLNQKGAQISYYYDSRLQNEPLSTLGTGTPDVHLHPVEPLGVRLTLTANF